jgi:hypothetical protein
MRSSIVQPTGPHAVGSVTHELVDADRPACLTSSARGRRLFLKLWYPAERSSGPEARPEMIWAQLRGDSRAPAVARALIAMLRHHTSTYAGATFAAAVTTSQIVIYNHGMVSFASENTSLVEELASHGYTVISVQHREQLNELRTLDRSQASAEKAAAANLARRISGAEAGGRASLAAEYYEACGNTNRIVRERAADTSFVLDRASEILAAIPGYPVSPPGTHAAHLVGFSVGGAVSTEVAMRDVRALSVTNLDGGTYGTIDVRSLARPCLMMYSQANAGMNDLLLPAQARRIVAEGTMHLNYHDVAHLVPGLRIFRAIGSADPRAFLVHRNETVRAFCAHVRR